MTANQLPLTRLHLTARADAPLQLPPYAGSMLRGAWGHALLALSPLPHSDDKPCALHASCPYCQLFAAPPLPGHSLQKFSHMPQPYVIEPPVGGAQRLAAGQTFGFHLVLIGKALALRPIVEQAWQRALRTGLGANHAPCTLLEIKDRKGLCPLPAKRESRLNLISPRAGVEAPHPSLSPEGRGTSVAPDLLPLPLGEGRGEGYSHTATLHFHTPLRLQVQGKPARADQLTARDLLVALARRSQLLADVHLGAAAPQYDFTALVEQAQAIELQAGDLHWFDWGRYSQRQQQEMQLGGLLGYITLRGDLTPFADLLHLGQWLHVGKNATMGLGGYRLEFA